MRFLFYRKRGKRSFKGHVHKIFKRTQNVVSTVKVREKFHELKCFISHGLHRFSQMMSQILNLQGLSEIKWWRILLSLRKFWIDQTELQLFSRKIALQKERYYFLSIEAHWLFNLNFVNLRPVFSGHQHIFTFKSNSV